MVRGHLDNEHEMAPAGDQKYQPQPYSSKNHHRRSRIVERPLWTNNLLKCFSSNYR